MSRKNQETLFGSLYAEPLAEPREEPKPTEEQLSAVLAILQRVGAEGCSWKLLDERAPGRYEQAVQELRNRGHEIECSFVPADGRGCIWTYRKNSERRG